jgi:hypothetical protein
VRIRREEISEYIEHYKYDVESEARLKAQVKQRFKEGKRYLTKNLFFKIAAWKTKRQRKHYENNSRALVEEVTRISFEKGRSEKVRIEILTILSGVNYPVASTLLHFAFPNRYPILGLGSGRANLLILLKMYTKNR